MAKIPPYSEAFKREAVELLRSSGRSVPQLAAELGVSPQSLRNWAGRSDVDDGLKPGLKSDERDELRRLRREVKILAEEREILKKAGGLLRAGERDPVTSFRFVAAKKAEHSITIMCRVLEVSRSGYHAWVSRPLSARAVEDQRLTARIRVLFEKRRKVYGSPRIWADLVLDDGERISRKRVERLMRQAELSGLIAKKYKNTTVRVPGVRVAEDLLDRNFAAGAPNRCWVADITYLRTWEGWLYLVAVQDLYSRRIVGWAMADHMRTELVTDALQMALAHRRPPPGLVWHSDQGSQFVSLAFGQQARAAGIAQSMGSKGDCFDNAVAESFFATLKKELVHRRSWPSKTELQTEIFDYIEVFYNRERRHSTLGQLSPAQYEQMMISQDLQEHQAA
ncbi:MAG TPA: IS3 family transposase [Baekduia sp.]|nr:IS3 family transposase [Baekduia sp.]